MLDSKSLFERQLKGFSLGGIHVFWCVEYSHSAVNNFDSIFPRP